MCDVYNYVSNIRAFVCIVNSCSYTNLLVYAYVCCQMCVRVCLCVCVCKCVFKEYIKYT